MQEVQNTLTIMMQGFYVYSTSSSSSSSSGSEPFFESCLASALLARALAAFHRTLLYVVELCKCPVKITLKIHTDRYAFKTRDIFVKSGIVCTRVYWNFLAACRTRVTRAKSEKKNIGVDPTRNHHHREPTMAR